MKKAIFIVLLLILTTVAILAQTEADFKVTLTADNQGVVITGYTGNVTAVRIPATIQGMPVKEIGSNAFVGYIVRRRVRESITSVVIPEGVTVIWGGAFSMEEKLSSVTLPSTLTKMGIGVFSYCTALMSINLPVGLEFMKNEPNGMQGGSQFHATGLTSIPSPWPSGITVIPEQCFSHSQLHGGIVIPEGITRIENSAFSNCSRITSVTLPSTISRIDHRAFEGCSSLTTIIIPESVQSIEFGGSVFDGCNINLASQVRLRQLGYTDRLGL